MAPASLIFSGLWPDHSNPCLCLHVVFTVSLRHSLLINMSITGFRAHQNPVWPHPSLTTPAKTLLPNNSEVSGEKELLETLLNPLSQLLQGFERGDEGNIFFSYFHQTALDRRHWNCLRIWGWCSNNLLQFYFRIKGLTPNPTPDLRTAE